MSSDKEIKDCKEAVAGYLVRRVKYEKDLEEYNKLELAYVKEMVAYEKRLFVWNNKWKYYRPMYLDYLKKAEFYAPCTGIAKSAKDAACRGGKGNVGAVGDWELNEAKDSKGCVFGRASPACRLKEDAISALMIKYDKDRGKPMIPHLMRMDKPVLIPLGNGSCCGLNLNDLDKMDMKTLTQNDQMMILNKRCEGVIKERDLKAKIIRPENFIERPNTILDYWDTPYKVDGNLSVDECKVKCDDDIKCKAFMRMYPKQNLSVRSGTYNNEQCAYLSKLNNPKVNNNGKGLASLYVKEPKNFIERRDTILDYWDSPYKVDGNLSVDQCKVKCSDDIKCKAFMRMYPKQNLSVRSGTYNNEQCAYLSNLHNPKVNANGKGLASLYVKD